MEGLLKPYELRFTRSGEHPERVLMVANEAGQNGKNGHPLMVRSYNFSTGQDGGEDMPLTQWAREIYRE